VNDGKLVDQLSAGRDEPMRRVLVS
jgi:hypothetical protein